MASRVSTIPPVRPSPMTMPGTSGWPWRAVLRRPSVAPPAAVVLRPGRPVRHFAPCWPACLCLAHRACAWPPRRLSRECAPLPRPWCPPPRTRGALQLHLAFVQCNIDRRLGRRQRGLLRGNRACLVQLAFLQRRFLLARIGRSLRARSGACAAARIPYRYACRRRSRGACRS